MSEPRRATVEANPKRKGWKWLLGALAAVVSVALIVGGYYAVTAGSTVYKIQREAGLLPGDDAERPPSNDTLNIMIMGSDSRGDDDPGRSDVLLLAHMPTDRSKLYLISFPRDLYVEIPGHGKNKINHAFAYGGPPLTVLTMENLLGIKIDHVVKVDFEGFIGVTDTIGGVTVNNKIATAGYPKGEITISGERALKYVRERKNLPGGTVDRAERQRVVLKAMLQQIVTPEVLSNPKKFGDVVNQLGKYMVTDDELTPGKMFNLASSTRLSSGNDIRLVMAPISGFSRSPKGKWIDIPHEVKMPEMALALQNDEMAVYYEKYKDAPLVG